ncbi:hypothetical protein D3C72_1082150 [compost metagenome]
MRSLAVEPRFRRAPLLISKGWSILSAWIRTTLALPTRSYSVKLVISLDGSSWSRSRLWPYKPMARASALLFTRCSVSVTMRCASRLMVLSTVRSSRSMS